MPPPIVKILGVYPDALHIINGQRKEEINGSLCIPVVVAACMRMFSSITILDLSRVSAFVLLPNLDLLLFSLISNLPDSFLINSLLDHVHQSLYVEAINAKFLIDSNNIGDIK